ncbi:MAG: type I restriction endonuclease subunit R [Methanobrevibacter sp.]|jgi:type I restriction enzyme R subunit|nr:type I restriction endonuclease subunit R [Candidatus Methanoflexus mossambicus]
MSEVNNEAQLEKSLIEKLIKQGYEYVEIKNEANLYKNLKKQLEKLNNISLSEDEFEKIKIHLDGGTVFDKSKKLRKIFSFKREKETIYIKFLNDENYSKNIFQVSNQINTKTDTNKKFRYDVTILINGFPLMQIELKRKGMGIKTAFDQIKKYKLHSYTGLFRYIQIFAISNGVNTKYFANNNKINDLKFEFTFFWKDNENNNIKELHDFADTFLNRFHLLKIISKYMVHNETKKIIMVFRAYQYYAVEKIIDRALNTNKNGYIWHATGSGKTLTSFKASQILEKEEKIDKIIFVVDRLDLDSQTIEEFNKFSNDSIDRTNNTKTLVNQLNRNKKLILTTIQKLNRAINIRRYSKIMDKIKDKKIVFIFDECHRSQSGTLHRDIRRFFTNAQYFGFTGTPIFNKNSKGGLRTTEELFGELLHSYTIKNAIEDNNVLKFSIDYIGAWKRRNGLDIDVYDIDKREAMEKPSRLESIAKHILEIHQMKTNESKFNGLFAVSFKEVAAKYYNIFKTLDHNYKIATIFSIEENDDVTDNNFAKKTLKEAIEDYNQLFNANYDVDISFNEYHENVSERFKSKEIDILIVVDMFLTGFDSQLLNTLYCDKKLEYHNLIQAFSRTNRVYDVTKPYGNIVCYRYLKEEVREALKLFSQEDSYDGVVSVTYEEYLEKFEERVFELRDLVPTYKDVDKLKSETEKKEFVNIFKKLLKLLNVMTPFVEFAYDDLTITKEEIESYKSKYLDIYDEVMRGIKGGAGGKTSVLEDLDFEIELIDHDEINVDFIIKLIEELDYSSPSYKKSKKEIFNYMKQNPVLRSKIKLIDKFIAENMPNDENHPFVKIDDVEYNLGKFLDCEKAIAINNIAKDESLDEIKLKKLIEKYEFSGKFKDNDIEDTFKESVSFLEKIDKIERIENSIEELVEKFNFKS